MSRSLVLAFAIALILHVLLAGVELDIFKRPLRVSNVPKALTLDVINAIEVKKPLKARKPPAIVKKPDKGVTERAITKKPKPKPPIKREKKRIHVKRPLPKKGPPTKTEALANLASSEIPREKEENGVSKGDYPFVPDVAEDRKSVV